LEEKQFHTRLHKRGIHSFFSKMSTVSQAVARRCSRSRRLSLVPFLLTSSLVLPSQGGGVLVLVNVDYFMGDGGDDNGDAASEYEDS